MFIQRHLNTRQSEADNRRRPADQTFQAVSTASATKPLQIPITSAVWWPKFLFFWAPLHLKHKRSNNPSENAFLFFCFFRRHVMSFLLSNFWQMSLFDDSAAAVSPSLALAPAPLRELLMVCQQLFPHKHCYAVACQPAAIVMHFCSLFSSN